MKGFNTNIEELTVNNNNFRQVLYTAKHCQLVLMSLPVGGEIGSEIHSENDQFLAMSMPCLTVVLLSCQQVLSIM